MTILFNIKAFEQGVSGTTAVYTAPELYAKLAQADKLMIQCRASQTVGTSPTISVDVEHSCDGVGWQQRTSPISAKSIPIGAVTYEYGEDTGAKVGGSKARLKITIGGSSNPGGYIEIWVTGRTAS